MAKSDSKRRLAAILIADAADYSRLMSLDEAGTYRQVRSHRTEVIDPKIAAFQGHIVNTAGDGLLADFPSVVSAVECAIDIQRDISERGKGVTADERLLWRIGINLGDVIVEADDIYGDGVNVAARLEKLAEPGGICISAAVFGEVRNKVRISFESLGEQWLKNIKEPIQVYRPRLDPSSGAPAVAAEERGSPQTILDRPSIAVLPFANLTPDRDKQYIVDGLTEDLITSLSMSPEFFVIARTSSFAFQQPRDLSAVARQLGVRYLVFGGVQQDRNAFRVSAQLIEAASGLQLWAGRFDRQNAELIEVRDEITHSIAATLMTTAGEIAKAELSRQSRKAPESFNVYDCYLRARAHFHRSLKPPWEAGRRESALARAEFARGIAMSDPPYWPLYAGLAWQHAIDFDWAYSEDAGLSARLAFENAEIAVKNAPDSHQSHWVMGWAWLYTKRDHGRAMEHYLKARELNIGDSRLLAEMAQLLIFTGDAGRAITQLRQAIRLNPLHEQWYDEFLAWAHEETGEPEEAVAILSRLDELEGIWSHLVLARAFVQLDALDQFKEQVDILDRLAQERLNRPFTLNFCREWVADREPYRDPARSERIVSLIERGLQRI